MNERDTIYNAIVRMYAHTKQNVDAHISNEDNLFHELICETVLFFFFFLFHFICQTKISNLIVEICSFGILKTNIQKYNCILCFTIVIT